MEADSWLSALGHVVAIPLLAAHPIAIWLAIMGLVFGYLWLTE